MFSYVILAMGALVFFATVYRYDMHEREPWWMLLAAAVVGALGVWGAFLLEQAVESAMLDGGASIELTKFTLAAMAGTFEELAKLLAPVLVLLLIRKHFNDPMDGLIYGSLAGLGAAVFEAAWWQLESPSAQATVLQEQGANLLRLLMHTVWGGIGGYALGLIVMKKPWRLTLARCVATVMAMHFAWDYWVAFAADQRTWQRLLAAGLLGGSIVWYGVLVMRLNKWSRSLHAPTSKKGLLGKVVKAIVFKRFK